MGVSEKCQKIRLHDLCSCGTIIPQTLGELLDALLRLSLLRQRPATQHSPLRHAIQKSLFLRQADGSFSAFLDDTYLAPELLGCRCSTPGMRQGIGVHTLLRQG